MPTANNQPYDPNRPPQFASGSESDTLAQWLYREFSALAIALSEQAALELRTINAPPPKPRDGMLTFADGVAWNPGSGKGLYVYKAGAWRFIA